jgi:hypothetical protein
MLIIVSGERLMRETIRDMAELAMLLFGDWARVRKFSIEIAR